MQTQEAIDCIELCVTGVHTTQTKLDAYFIGSAGILSISVSVSGNVNELYFII